MKYDLVVSPFNVGLAQIVEVARCAEESGFDGVWTLDHLSGTMIDRGRSHDVFTTLGAIGAVTSSIRIGPLVANMINYHPARLALAMASLQSLTGGRAVLGLGAGAGPGSRFAREHIAIGTNLLTAPERRRRLIETIDAVKYCWANPADREGTFTGEYYTIDGELLGEVTDEEPMPPVIIGVNGPVLAALAVNHAQGVNINLGPQTGAVLDLVGDRGARDPGFEVSLHLEFDPDHPQGGELVNHPLAAEADRVTLAIAEPFDLAGVARVGDRLSGVNQSS